MKRPRYAESARDDLRDILDFSSNFSEHFATKRLDQLIEGCRFASRHPGLGQDRSDLGEGIRSRCVSEYLIFLSADQILSLDLPRHARGSRHQP